MANSALEDPRTRAAQYVVEASDWEQRRLWMEHAAKAASFPNMGGGARVAWESHSDGWGPVVGTLAGHNVAISVKWAVVGGVLVLFWFPCSRVVDHDLCHNWLSANVPAYAQGRNCDADTFRQCLAFAKEKPHG